MASITPSPFRKVGGRDLGRVVETTWNEGREVANETKAGGVSRKPKPAQNHGPAGRVGFTRKSDWPTQPINAERLGKKGNGKADGLSLGGHGGSKAPCLLSRKRLLPPAVSAEDAQGFISPPARTGVEHNCVYRGVVAHAPVWVLELGLGCKRPVAGRSAADNSLHLCTSGCSYMAAVAEDAEEG